MGSYLVQALVNGIGVAVGLYVLWSFTRTAPGRRAGYAAVAGLVSAVLTFVIPVVAGGMA
jgi:hypothetical protein